MKLKALVLILTAVSASAQTTRPTMRPSLRSESDMKAMSAEQVFEQMLKPASEPSRQLRPLPEGPVQDKSTGSTAVKPNVPSTALLREGTFIIDRMGRLTKTDKGQWEFTWEADGKAMRDPPMLLLPNQKLQQLEDTVIAQGRDLKVRVTGKVTEYRGRNYLLLDMMVFPPEVTQQF